MIEPAEEKKPLKRNDFFHYQTDGIDIVMLSSFSKLSSREGTDEIHHNCETNEKSNLIFGESPS